MGSSPLSPNNLGSYRTGVSYISGAIENWPVHLKYLHLEKRSDNWLLWYLHKFYNLECPIDRFHPIDWCRVTILCVHFAMKHLQHLPRIILIYWGCWIHTKGGFTLGSKSKRLWVHNTPFDGLYFWTWDWTLYVFWAMTQGGGWPVKM